MCDGEPVWSDIATAWGNNTLMGLGCPNPANGTNDFTLLIYGQGNYSTLGPVVCAISPKITSVKVEYGSTVRTTIVDPLVTNDPASTAIMSQIAIGVVQRRILHGQNLNTNDVGEALWAILFNMNSTAFSLEVYNQEMLEGYITGIMEFSATLYRASAFSTANWAKSVNHTLYEDYLSMTTNNTGHYNTETLGYDHRFDINLLILLPLLCVSLATIGLILWARLQTRKLRRARRSENVDSPGYVPELDVGNPFHLMAAASAGGMSGAFSGRLESVVKESGRIRVTRADDGVGFVQVNPEDLKFEG